MPWSLTRKAYPIPPKFSELMISTKPSSARSPPTTPMLPETLLRMPMTILLVVRSI
ncbi:hypothetical protein D9M73_225310 [compost metagenome]